MKLKTLGERWRAFLSVAVDPWTVFLLLGTLALFWASMTDPPPKGLTSALLFVLLTVAASVLGARVAQLWSAITEQSVVQARGIAAVRSLKLLLRNIAALESRAREFRANEAHIASNAEVTKRNFEEVRAACIVLQEEAVSSIENWTDIVEEADVRTQIGVITTLKADLDARTLELASAKDTLEKKEGQSAEAKKRLQEDIAKMQERVTELQREVFEKSLGISGGGSLSSIFSGNQTPSALSSLLAGAGPVLKIDTSGGLLDFKPSRAKE